VPVELKSLGEQHQGVGCMIGKGRALLQQENAVLDVETSASCCCCASLAMMHMVHHSTASCSAAAQHFKSSRWIPAGCHNGSVNK
jgi:hypothetical protein